MLAKVIFAAPIFLLGALPLSAQDAVVARLDGTSIISEADLSGWSAAQACYGEGALTSRRAAFMRLTEAALADKAMRENGGPVIDDAVVAADAARIDRETQAPDILACIKGALGKDYQRIFVRPSVTEASLRLFLMRDAAVQAPARKKVETAQQRALKGESLEAVSKELGLYYSSATYSLNPATASFRPETAPAEYQKEFIAKHLKGLSVGKFLDEPLESDYTFQAVRLLAQDEKGWFFETAVARKVGQEDWFAGLKKAKLEVLDAELHGWVKGIKGNPRLKAVEVAP